MIEYELIRSSRKTLALEIKPDGRLIARAPLRMPKAEIDRFVKQKEGWIISHRETARQKQEERENARSEALSFAEIQALADQALIVFPEKVRYYAKLVGVSYGRITIRNQKTRWGSCTEQGNLNFNCLLMLAPDEVRDYVVVHELCHRKEMNHSARFWSEVERVLPNYREPRKWLKDHGGEIMARGGLR